MKTFSRGNGHQPGPNAAPRKRLATIPTTDLSDVARALVRAASTILSTPIRALCQDHR